MGLAESKIDYSPILSLLLFAELEAIVFLPTTLHLR